MKPILFNTEMVRAILEGRKTVTRRAFEFKMRGGRNPNFSGYSLGEYCTGRIESGAVLYSRRGDGGWEQVTDPVKPRYLPGDILWVRETWHNWPDDCGNNYFYMADDNGEGFSPKWHPSIHMPKEAARLFLRVTGVRVERLQDITEEQCEKEGMTEIQKSVLNEDEYWYWFKNPWNTTIKPGDIDTYGWDANPWVWVIEFERCEKPEEDTHAES